VLPSCIIVLTLAYVYYRFRGLTLIQGILQGLRPAVIAMIASAGLSLIILSIYGQKTLPSDLTQIQIIPILIFIVSLAVLRIRKPDPIKVMASAGAAGIVLFSLF
jgi:chromate transporter